MVRSILEKILPPAVRDTVLSLSLDKLCEIRLRSGGAVTVYYGGRYGYITPRGLSDAYDNAVVLQAKDIERVLLLCCDRSLYAVNDRICDGYITLAQGIRVGIAGETVWDGAHLKTVKNFTALCVRIPHEVRGCADALLPALRCGDGYHSTLLVSPPGAGKTTLLRELARQAAGAKKICNVLVADERDEIAAAADGRPTLDVGRNADVMGGCTKEYAFLRGIRSLRPDVIVTDELCSKEDLRAVMNAVAGGVCVFASVHAGNHADLARKPVFSELTHSRCFTRYVDLSSRNGPGTVEGVFDENFLPVSEGQSV